MIDVRTEQLLSLGQATQEIPGRPHVSTLIRWFQQGVSGVKLETIVIGGRRFTSVEAIDRFIQQRNLQTSPTTSPSKAGPNAVRVKRPLAGKEPSNR